MNIHTLDHLRMIKYAANVQATDSGIWAMPEDALQSIAEAYLQQSIRDLHLVIEHSDREALLRIEARADAAEDI